MKNEKNDRKVRYDFYSNGRFNEVWANEKVKFHREDGPAFPYPNGTRAWYKNGKLHREDGPAMVWHNGKHEYYLEDKEYSKEDYWKEIEKRKENKKG